MKDVTLYEDEAYVAVRGDLLRRADAHPFAEVERLQAAARERHWDELLAGTTAATKLNEARAEAANMAQAAETWRASYEAADKALIEARAEAARYREALERIATGHSGTAPDPLPLSRWEQRNLARAALRGGDGHG